MKLTNFIPQNDRCFTGELEITPVAASFVASEIRDKFPAAMIAESARTFLTSVYFQRSAWFRDQTVHTLPVLDLNSGDMIVLRISRTHGGHIIRMGAEVDLPDDYYERRVVEEARCES